MKLAPATVHSPFKGSTHRLRHVLKVSHIQTVTTPRPKTTPSCLFAEARGPASNLAHRLSSCGDSNGPSLIRHKTRQKGTGLPTRTSDRSGSQKRTWLLQNFVQLGKRSCLRWNLVRKLAPCTPLKTPQATMNTYLQSVSSCRFPGRAPHLHEPNPPTHVPSLDFLVG